MNSSAHNYLAESNGGTYQFTEYGINFMRQVNKDLRVGAQLFGRDLGDIGNSRLNLDWMYADLRLSGSLRLRVGKMFTPMGFHSEGRDIDLLRSTVLLPQSVYFDTFRDNFAFNGVVLQGDQPLLEGLLDFKLFRGGFNMADDAPGMQDLSRFFGPFFLQATQAQMTQAGVPQAFQPNRYSSQNLWGKPTEIQGFRFVWSSANQDWRMGYSEFSAGSEINGEILLSPGAIRLPFSAPLRINKFSILSAEYNWNRFKATFERLDNKMNLAGNSLIMEGYYHQLEYRLDETKELSFSYSQFYPFVEKGKGSGWAPPGFPDHRSYQTDRGLSLRVDLNNHAVLKLEYHWMNGTAQLREVLNPIWQDQRNWEMFLIKTTIKF